MNPSTRRSFFKRTGLYMLGLPFLNLWKYFFGSKKEDTGLVYFTNGLKISELRPGSAIIWTRLCGGMNPVPVSHKRIDKGGTDFPVDFDEDMAVREMDGAVPGAEGEVRLILNGGDRQLTSEWYAALSEKDFTVHIPVRDLKSSSVYSLTLEGRINEHGKTNRIQGHFRTPSENHVAVPVLLATSTCQYFWNFDDPDRGYKTYDSMRRLKPDLFLQTGDYVYYDRPGPMVDTMEKARHKWHAMNSWPSLRTFLQRTPIYMMKDDHDLLSDDAWKKTKDLGEFTYSEGLEIWHENVPLEDKPYRTFRWGKDLQIWLIEGREYRKQDEDLVPADRSIWGQDQKEWLQKTVKESDATFKILISPMPIIGPDRAKKADNHSNTRFRAEGDWARDFISEQGMYIVNGDRHWQYVSKDVDRGIWEFGSGPVSDAHAGGWKQDDVRPEHRFLRVKGGFLAVEVNRNQNRPIIEFTHYDVDGNPLHREQFEGYDHSGNKRNHNK